MSKVAGRSGDSFISPILQRERLEQWCAAQGHDLVDVREDMDVSGARSDRPNLLQLIEAVEIDQLDGVIVARLDRFGRSLPFAIALIERIDAAGGQFVSVADGLDTRTPYGRLALNVLLSIAQFELERYREQWKDATTRMIGRGVHPGAVPPFGYQRAADGRLAIDPATGPLMTEAFMRRAGGESVSDTTRWLQATGAKTTHGGVPSRRMLREAFANRVYLGEARYGPLVQKDAHPAVIDEKTFERVQRIATARPPRHGDPAVLAGLIRCQGCRYAMAPVYRDGRRRYRCLGVQQQRKCPRPAFVTEHELLPVVEEALFDRLEDIRADAAGDLAAVDAARETRDEAISLLRTYRDDPAILAALGAREYAEGLTVKQAAVDSAERELAQALTARPMDLPDAATLRGMWPQLIVRERQQLLRIAFDAIVIRKHPSRSQRLAIGDRVMCIESGALEPSEVPSSGRRDVDPLPPFYWPSDPPSAGIDAG